MKMIIALLALLASMTAFAAGPSPCYPGGSYVTCFPTSGFKFGSGTINVNASGTVTLPSATDTLVGKATTDVLTNKTLSGNTATNLVSGSGTLTLNTSGTVTVPNATDTLVGKATTDVLTNKTLSGNTATNLISGSGTLTLPTSGTVTVPSATDTLLGRQTTDTVKNKTFDGTNTWGGLANTGFTLSDPIDQTKSAQFDSGTIATGTTRTFTFPNASMIFAGRNVNNSFTAAQNFGSSITQTAGSLTIGGNTTSDANLGAISSVQNNNYYFGSFAATFTVGVWTSQTVSINYVKTGRLVCLDWAGKSASANATNIAAQTAAGVLPSALWPAHIMEAPVVQTFDSTTIQAGIAMIVTDGTLRIYKTTNESGTFTSGNSVGWDPFSICYTSAS